MNITVADTETAVTPEQLIANLMKENAELRARPRTASQVLFYTLRWAVRIFGFGLAYQVLAYGIAPWGEMDTVAHIVGWPVFLLIDIFHMVTGMILWVAVAVAVAAGGLYGADRFNNWNRSRRFKKARLARQNGQADTGRLGLGGRFGTTR